MVRLVNTRESGFITGSLVLDEGVVIEEFDAVIIAFQGPDEVTSAKVDKLSSTGRSKVTRC